MMTKDLRRSDATRNFPLPCSRPIGLRLDSVALFHCFLPICSPLEARAPIPISYLLSPLLDLLSHWLTNPQESAAAESFPTINDIRERLIVLPHSIERNLATLSSILKGKQNHVVLSSC